jgi:hypothetical protein
MLALLALALLGGRPDPLVTWRVADALTQENDRPAAVGSLLKPFVAKAWARAHAGATPPAFRCEKASGCWRPSGHGTVDLARALALSCNAYFRRLAAETPREVLEGTLADEGFLVPRPLSPDGAIGLPSQEGSVAIRPSALLAAYVRLTRTPWATGETVRQAVLAGLRQSPQDGTAAGIGHAGLWAKTGTVPALDGRPLTTSGWAIAIDDTGWAILGLLPHGTGHEAARALADPISHERPGLQPSVAAPGAPPSSAAPRPEPPPGDGRVRVLLFDALHPRSLVARNISRAPVGASDAFVGSGATVALRPGDRLEPGLWEVTLPGRGLVRRIAGGLACRGDAAGRLDLVAEVTPLEYVAGVLLAELPGEEGAVGRPRHAQLGAAVLRFLAGGPRHAAADVCDSTHCAWFLGRGPRVRWSSPTRVALLAAPRETDASEPALDPETWSQILALAREGGPRQWTGHCGGTPLSAHFVWGNGDRSVVPCPRHSRATAVPWTRRWTDAAVAQALGEGVASLAVTEVEGVWTLRAESLELRYDEAHRRLARVLGWDALPSPAESVRRVPGGFEARGFGFGHRVGLCLGD